MSTEYWQKPTPICCWQIKFCSNINFSSFSIETKTRGSQLGEGNNRKASRSHKTLFNVGIQMYTSFSRYFNEANTVLREISLAPLDLTRHVSGVLISRESRCWRLIEWDESNIYLQKCERSIIMFALRAGELPARVMPAKCTLYLLHTTEWNVFRYIIYRH